MKLNSRVIRLTAVVTLLVCMIISLGVFSSSAAEKKITLRLGFWFHEEDLPFWKKGIESFQAKHPNVEVVIETTPWAQYWTKLQTQIVGNSAPDIIGMVSMYSQQYIRQGSLLNLTPFIKKDTSFDAEDFWPQIMTAYSYKGNVYAFPYDLSTMALLGNVSLFEKTGLEFPVQKWTWSEFLSACKKLSKDTDGDGKIDQWAVYWYPLDWALNYVLGINGATMFTEDRTKTLLNTPAAIQALQDWADLYLKLKVAPTPPESTIEDIPLFESEKVAMTGVNPEWVMVRKLRMPDAKLDVAPFPYKGRPMGEVAGGSFAINAKTKYPEIAWEFLKHFTSQEVLKLTVADAFRGIPGRKSLVDAFLKSKNGVPNAKLFIDTISYSKNYSITRYDQVMAIMQSGLQELYLGLKPAKQVTEEMARKIALLLP